MKKIVGLTIVVILFYSCNNSTEPENNTTKLGSIAGTVASKQGYSNIKLVAFKNALVTTLPGSKSVYTNEKGEKGALDFNQIPLGTYNLIFSKQPYYQDKNVSINLNSEINISDVTLELINSKVSFNIDISLAGKLISFYIDDEYVGLGQFGYSVPSKILHVGNHKFYATYDNLYRGPQTNYVQVEEYFWRITSSEAKL